MRSCIVKLYPNKTCREALNDTLEQCRWLYNRILEEINTATKEGREIRKAQTQALIPKLAAENPRLASVYSKTLQMVNHTLWSNIAAQRALRRDGRRIGRLRFKGKDRFRVINFNQSGFRIERVRKKIALSKIGEINAKLHREINGDVRGIIVKRYAGDWFAILQIREHQSKELPMTDKCVGIDVGITHFAADSDGALVENPRFVEKSSQRIALLQRRLSRKKEGSRNREKAKERLALAYRKLNNRRNDFIHKLSRYYINNYDTIVVERLEGKDLLEKGRNRTLHRNIADAAWRRFRNMLTYKAESAGRQLALANPSNTSQTCSRCGCKKEGKERMRLHDRIFTCGACGFNADRDYNASVNILKSGSGRPFVPSERAPLPSVIPYEYINSGQVFSMNKETHGFRRG